MPVALGLLREVAKDFAAVQQSGQDDGVAVLRYPQTVLADSDAVVASFTPQPSDSSHYGEAGRRFQF